MQRVQPDKAKLKKFLDSAVIDPNKKGNLVEQQLVENGDAPYFEIRVIEFMGEARRLRERMKHASGKGLATLVEEYNVVMRKAASNIAISTCKVEMENTPAPKSPIKTVPPAEKVEGTE
jgi:hypothetical protein